MLSDQLIEEEMSHTKYTGSNLMAVQEIPIKKITLARNSRMSISDGDLSELMSSIKSVGLLQPIGVIKKGSNYQVCYGNRRFLAMSRLGHTRIPAIIHEETDAYDGDLKNLTENIQRRNISLSEIGRYMKILNDEGLSTKEIAARLGMSPGFLKSCERAYHQVPKEYRDDLEVKSSNKKTTPGKINMKSAQAIISAHKTYNLGPEEKRTLFKAAKSDSRFTAENVNKYATAIKAGIEDPIGSVKPLKQFVVRFIMPEQEYDRLRAEFINDGPFRSISALFEAILTGKKAVKVNLKES